MPHFEIARSSGSRAQHRGGETIVAGHYSNATLHGRDQRVSLQMLALDFWNSDLKPAVLNRPPYVVDISDELNASDGDPHSAPSRRSRWMVSAKTKSASVSISVASIGSIS